MSDADTPAPADDQMVEVQVAGLTVDRFTNMPIVLLREVDSDRVLPIWIGITEASAIATQLEQVELARPMTHDLLRSMIELLGANVDQIDVLDLRDNTFYATITLQTSDRRIPVDARPSDAVALALRTGSTIRVAQAVMDEASTVAELEGPGDEDDEAPVELDDDESAEGTSAKRRDQWSQLLEELDPEDFGKHEL